MSSLSIKDVPESWAETLRRRAERNHRSLQGELMAILEEAIMAPSSRSSHWTETARIETGFNISATQQGKRSIEQVAQDLRLRLALPVADAALGVDIIRAERDAR
jgi:plasmid stability protein